MAYKIEEILHFKIKKILDFSAVSAITAIVMNFALYLRESGKYLYYGIDFNLISISSAQIYNMIFYGVLYGIGFSLTTDMEDVNKSLSKAFRMSFFVFIALQLFFPNYIYSNQFIYILLVIFMALVCFILYILFKIKSKTTIVSKKGFFNLASLFIFATTMMLMIQFSGVFSQLGNKISGVVDGKYLIVSTSLNQYIAMEIYKDSNNNPYIIKGDYIVLPADNTKVINYKTGNIYLLENTYQSFS